MNVEGVWVGGHILGPIRCHT